jgi:hypothetical protein
MDTHKGNKPGEGKPKEEEEGRREQLVEAI